HVWRYARRVRTDPAASLVASVPPPAAAETHDVPLDGRRIGALAAVVATLLVLVYGLTQRDWSLVEMSALFFGLRVLLTVIGRLHPNSAAVTFGRGAAELTMTALLIGSARAIHVVLDDGGVIDTIVHGLSVPLEAMGPSFAAVGMLVVQGLTNLFIR